MKQRTVTSLIYRVVALALAGLMLVAGLNIYYGLRLRSSTAAMRTVNLATTRLLFQVNSLLREQSALVNTAPSMSDIAAIKQNQDHFAQLGSQLDQSLEAIAKLSTDAELAGLIKSLKERSAPRRAAADKVFSLAAGFQQTESLASLQTTFGPADEQLHQSAILATTRTLDLVDLKPAEILQLVATNTSAGIALSLTTIIVVIGFSVWTVQRGILRPMRRMIASLAETGEANLRSAGQISSASQTLAEGSSEQAAAIEETSSSLEELASMTRRNAENSQKANDLSKQTRAAADKGVADMEDMNTAMQALKVSSGDIAKIIKTIDEIAFQTNILALNAAVEAARAGEAGMGFAVVADEVRNLAQRSAQAAKETATKIEGAITKTAQGVELSDKVSQALNDIVAKARQVDELAAEVAGASREQTQGITQINTAVSQMDKVTQSNAASAEESASAAGELNAHAELLKQAVGSLTQLVGGRVETVTTRSATSLPRAGHATASPASVPAARRIISTSGNGSNGIGHRNEIPLDGDFKNF